VTPAAETLVPGAADSAPVLAGGEGAFAPVAFSPAYSHRTFAGLPVATVILGALVLVLSLWATWATRELMQLRDHRIVSVSLGSIVRDFIANEARARSTPDQAAYRTRVYLDATQGAMRNLASKNTTILVSEAVVGNSVPDITSQVKTAVDAKMNAVTHDR
jgi:hypothetical protein